MIKRFHEAPKKIFKEIQQLTDGDYALVNLFDEDEEYFNLFVDAVASGREVILDNGVFELGTAWDSDKFAGWVEKLKPTYYIVPDVLEDCDATIESFEKFTSRYKDLPGKIMGVAQGNTYDEVVRCYRAIEPKCDKVCIGFDYSFFQNIEDGEEDLGHFYNAVLGRRELLVRMAEHDVINRKKPHHLLGVMLPQEVTFYNKCQTYGGMQWIDSIDTSNPIVHGMHYVKYKKHGLDSKISTKLYTQMYLRSS